MKEPKQFEKFSCIISYSGYSTHIFMFHLMKDSHLIPIIFKVFSWRLNFDKKYLEIFQKCKKNIHKFFFHYKFQKLKK